MERYRFTDDRLSFMEQSQIPFAVYQFVDRRVVTLALSAGFLRLFGYEDRAQAYDDMDHNMYVYTHPDDAARIANAAVRFATEGGKYDVVYRSRKKNGGGYMVIHAMGEHVNTETGERLAQVWYTDEGAYTENASQETPLCQAMNNALHEESILKASQYDYLSGLPSMSYFFEMSEAAKQAILDAGEKPAMLFMDLYGMKFFNTRNGFAVGDKQLQGFAKLLARHFHNENCCRISGDHFAVLTREAGLEEALESLFREAARLNEGSALPVHVGIYVCPEETGHVSTACDRAKLACDALGNVYESCFNYYHQSLRDSAAKYQYIVSSLDRAISEKWIQIYYQPIIRAVSGRICDEEALSRWTDPELGMLSPAEFIPALEEAGQIYKLDLYVLDHVLEKIKIQMENGIYVVPNSINLSRSDFDACDIVEEVRKRVDAAGVARDRITVEITESVIGSDFEFMKKQVERFQALGFPVWMDDFGSGYSSLDVLQSIKFNLLKFDMSFMRKLDEGQNGKIILTELMKMASALDVDTVCEGVETQEQARFLQEIGCSKLQGYYFSKPVPFSEILDSYKHVARFGYENPEESAYYEAVGRLNLYDLALIASGEDSAFQHFFNTIPMGVIEIKGDTTRFVRSNQTYRDFIKRYFGIDMSYLDGKYRQFDNPFMKNVVKICCEQGSRAFYDEKMPDGSIVHSFARRICTNPTDGTIAVATAVLSITDPDATATFVDIARALAADYYNIYVIDLETDRFIEYTSTVGGEELSMQRHGEGFFDEARRETLRRIYEDDRQPFLDLFTKENVVRDLDEQGVFTTSYRLIDTGSPMYVNMKITRMQPGGSRIIMGISIIDAQMKQKERLEQQLRERDTLARVMALSEDYLTLYTVHPETGRYIAYSSTERYESIGLTNEGEDFFGEARVNAKRAIFPEDLPLYLEKFTKENILNTVREQGIFKLSYRLMIGGEPVPVSLKIASFKEGEEEKLVVGVRAWKPRK